MEIYFLLILLLLLWSLYEKLTKDLKVFEKRGVPYEKAYPVIGNTQSTFGGRESLQDLIQRFYNKFYSEK